MAVLQRQKVLVLSGGFYIRNFLALLQQIDGRNGNMVVPLAETIHTHEFDAIVLKLRWPDVRPKDEVQGFKEVDFAWEGKLLVVNAQLNGPQTSGLLEHYLIGGPPQATPTSQTRTFHSTL